MQIPSYNPKINFSARIPLRRVTNHFNYRDILIYKDPAAAQKQLDKEFLPVQNFSTNYFSYTSCQERDVRLEKCWAYRIKVNDTRGGSTHAYIVEKPDGPEMWIGCDELKAKLALNLRYNTNNPLYKSSGESWKKWVSKVQAASQSPRKFQRFLEGCALERSNRLAQKASEAPEHRNPGAGVGDAG